MKALAALAIAGMVSGCVTTLPDPGMIGTIAGGPPATGAPVSGMVRVAPDLAVDPAASPAQIAAIRAHLTGARAATARALGQARARPDVQVCVTPECDSAQGFKTRGLSYADRWMRISSRAWDHRATYTHELVHVETHTPDLLLARAIRPVPIWFDEGLATHISGTVGASLPPKRCANLRSLELPVPQNGFGAFTKKHGFETGYGAAACRVKDWLAKGHRTQDVIGLMRVGGLPR